MGVVKNTNFGRDCDLLAAICLALSQPDLPGASPHLSTSPQTVVNMPVCPCLTMEVLLLMLTCFDASCLQPILNLRLHCHWRP